MKQIYIQIPVQNPDPKGIVDASVGSFQISSRLKPSGINAQDHALSRRLLSLSKQGAGGGSNIFLIQNKGKGPPGRQRSPGVIQPGSPNVYRDQKPVRFGIPEQTDLLLTTKTTFKQRSLSLSKGNRIHTESQFFEINTNQFLFTIKFLLS